jgi:predicted nucleic acid-binding protein
MSHKPAYIVIDTNVLISAGLLPQSTTAQALAVALTHSVFTQNQDTWHELETGIAPPKFDRHWQNWCYLKTMRK